MTTPTPYDEQIEAHDGKIEDDLIRLAARRNGYLRAKADLQPLLDAYAELLEAAQRVVATERGEIYANTLVTHEFGLAVNELGRAAAAVKEAKGRGE